MQVREAQLVLLDLQEKEVSLDSLDQLESKANVVPLDPRVRLDQQDPLGLLGQLDLLVL